jgi:hypothetical protein
MVPGLKADNSNLRLKLGQLEAKLLLSEGESRSKLLKDGFIPATQAAEYRSEILELHETLRGLRIEIRGMQAPGHGDLTMKLAHENTLLGNDNEDLREQLANAVRRANIAEQRVLVLEGRVVELEGNIRDATITQNQVDREAKAQAKAATEE